MKNDFDIHTNCTLKDNVQCSHLSIVEHCALETVQILNSTTSRNGENDVVEYTFFSYNDENNKDFVYDILFGLIWIEIQWLNMIIYYNNSIIL